MFCGCSSSSMQALWRLPVPSPSSSRRGCAAVQADLIEFASGFLSEHNRVAVRVIDIELARSPCLINRPLMHRTIPLWWHKAAPFKFLKQRVYVLDHDDNVLTEHAIAHVT